ncbi:VIT1/CCC1 transporter family protein [Actinomyces minihominis]|uniref:VIT1/CCC1 transporter family protein n=1 Tax=Actinomyces minihominis TaxID=2002838 RepID=UPI000C0787E5|nr:VIT1/CCC1 transporter family protein [Actinomyces minihominis]
MPTFRLPNPTFFLNRYRDNSEEWSPRDDAQWRELLSIGNDGIISSAAIIQGLLAGGATGQEAIIGVSALIVIGVATSAATQYAKSESERQAQLKIVEREQKALESSPEEELEELARIYELKGLSPKLSLAVAKELTANDALRAQLEAEYDMDEIPGKDWAWRKAGLAGLAFLGGTILPLLFLLILPWDIRGEITVISVVIALIISGWIGHLVEHTSAWRAILRTLLIGLVILGISALAGSLVTF